MGQPPGTSHRRSDQPLARLVALFVVSIMVAAACNGGARPTLVAPPGPTPATPLVLDLPAAPPAVTPLAPSPRDLPLESSVDDALVSWAIDRSVPYVDSCDRMTTVEDQLCDSPTDRDTVRLLGPSSSDIWYVITVSELTSFDLGTGYRVTDVTIAGR